MGVSVLVRASVSFLNLTGLLMQLCCARVGRGLLAVKPLYLGVGRGLGFELGLPLVLQGPDCALFRTLLTFERSIVQALVSHPRNIAPTG